MTTDPTPNTEVAPVQLGEAIARIEGTRPCLQCGQNLQGQPIFRLQPYNFLVARCSECGAVTPLQEYPVLGAWGRRLGMVLVGLYVLLSVLMFIAQGLIYWFLTYLNTWEALRPIGRGLGRLIDQKYPELNLNGWQGYDPALLESIDPALVAGTWQIRFLLSPDIFGGVLAGVIIGFFFGCLWSILLLGVRQRLLWFAPVLTVAMGWFLTLTMVWVIDSQATQMNQNEIAMYLFGVRTATFYSTIWLVCGIVGALIGRPLCRLISALVLPPRQRLALAPLWTCDGLEPPFHKWWDRR